MLLVNVYVSDSLRLPRAQLRCLQYKAVDITSLVVEQLCVVYKISIPKCSHLITYFKRRLGTWLCQCMHVMAVNQSTQMDQLQCGKFDVGQLTVLSCQKVNAVRGQQSALLSDTQAQPVRPIYRKSMVIESAPIPALTALYKVIESAYESTRCLT